MSTIASERRAASRLALPLSSDGENASDARLTLELCRKQVPAFERMLTCVASEFDVYWRALEVRTLLHLPRMARPDGTIALAAVMAELRRNAGQLRSDHWEIKDLVPEPGFLLSDLRFVGLASHQANQIFGRLHYLRSARHGSINFALIDPLNHLPVTLCSVSPLDWARVGRRLQTQFGVPFGTAWEVSRVYSHRGAPKFAISQLLSKVRQVLAQEIPDAEVLTTAVDPNLGFQGTSYRAANWQQWMSIEARPYLYVDREYASPRQLRASWGSANLEQLGRQNPDVLFEKSGTKLLDSLIFCCRLRDVTEVVPIHERRRVRR
ncbi:hypothetical protein [Kribbella sp. VKM Ac-2571]|uniref:Mom family adenine methylcarbamoylation protein n=1 Tax=Kribbella sp. VKM Ac-2571 TaxID=2512222 RepID=UPI00105FA242|nr:hypothetical protein [Kribbella sp. VKM Ac-2571]